MRALYNRLTPVLRAYRRRLAEAGYRIVGVPELRTRELRDTTLAFDNVDFTYCNMLPGMHRGRPAVHYLPWGIPPLDAAAARAFRAAGVAPVALARTPHLAGAMMQRAAGLRCFCGAMP